MEARGLDIQLVSLRWPTDRRRHAIHDEVRAPVLYLPEYLWRGPLRVLRGWRHARRLPGYAAARAAWLRDLKRDPTPNRIRRFGQALVLARELPPRVGHLHAHFLHTPASVTRYAAILLGLPWSVSAHAKDIWTIPDWEKREKLREAAWAVTCTEAGRAHLDALTPGKVELVYHGVELDRFAPRPRLNTLAPCERGEGEGHNDRRAVRRAPNPSSATPLILASPGGDGPLLLPRGEKGTVTILSVGRAVAKKGYDDLLEALALLPEALEWRFVHIGGGALAKALKAQAKRLGLASRIEWRGARTQDEVLAAYRAADLFVLASRTAVDGDRDGLPNVLMEAQSQGLPCISTTVSGIPELIRDGETGLLVPPGDPRGLADALARLIRDPALRHHLGRAGEARVRARFAAEPGFDRLAAKFGMPAAELAIAG
jgi:glycosyltransferase involved in cell wall biosynthesis